ncbi:MAG: leucine-rich repeat domain-containing protein [Muribaculaceae bacterium]|nr:leucine-rich repeat domain-containing protein [Muribaculaceae bacterium]
MSVSETLIIERPISEMEFADRTDISEVIFREGSGNTEIPDYAFLGCSALKKVILSPDVRKIGFQAFSECSSLERVEMPDSLEDIGSNAFAYCSRLDSIRFPAALRHIGHNAFSFCSSLQEAYLPDSLLEIESYAFSDCGSLRKVRLPDNAAMLGELLMNCCDSLVEIIEPSVEVPPIDCGSFIFDPEDEAAYIRCVLIVPEESLNDYDVSKSWQGFNKIAIKGDEPGHR